MGKYLWRGALLGFLITLVLGGVLFAFSGESTGHGWITGTVPFIKAVVIPTLVTTFMGIIVGIWLGRMWSQGSSSLVKGFLIGAVLFFVASFAWVVTLPFLGTAVLSLVNLPGVFISDIFTEPFLKYLRGENFLIVTSREPLIGWTRITVSWLVWGLIGAAIGHLRRKESRRY